MIDSVRSVDDMMIAGMLGYFSMNQQRTPSLDSRRRQNIVCLNLTTIPSPPPKNAYVPPFLVYLLSFKGLIAEMDLVAKDDLM